MIQLRVLDQKEYRFGGYSFVLQQLYEKIHFPSKVGLIAAHCLESLDTDRAAGTPSKYLGTNQTSSLKMGL